MAPSFISGAGDPRLEASSPAAGTILEEKVARATGLEPATSGVTGRHSNRLSYARASDRIAKAPGSVFRDGGALVPVNGHAVK